MTRFLLLLVAALVVSANAFLPSQATTGVRHIAPARMTTLPMEQGALGALPVGLLHPASLALLESRLPANVHPDVKSFFDDARREPLSAMRHFSNPEVMSCLQSCMLGEENL